MVVPALVAAVTVGVASNVNTVHTDALEDVLKHAVGCMVAEPVEGWRMKHFYILMRRPPDRADVQRSSPGAGDQLESNSGFHSDIESWSGPDAARSLTISRSWSKSGSGRRGVSTAGNP